MLNDSEVKSEEIKELAEIEVKMKRENDEREAYLEMIRDLASMQARFEPIKTNKENPFYKSKYADLTCIMEYLRPLLAEHGFAVSHECSLDDSGRELLTTYLLHTKGSFRSSTSVLNYKTGDPQALGKAQHYCERYNIRGLTGITIVDEDDDAEGAMDRSKPLQKVETPKSTPTKAATKKTTLQAAQEEKAAIATYHKYSAQTPFICDVPHDKYMFASCPMPPLEGKAWNDLTDGECIALWARCHAAVAYKQVDQVAQEKAAACLAQVHRRLMDLKHQPHVIFQPKKG